MPKSARALPEAGTPFAELVPGFRFDFDGDNAGFTGLVRSAASPEIYFGTVVVESTRRLDSKSGAVKVTTSPGTKEETTVELRFNIAQALFFPVTATSSRRRTGAAAATSAPPRQSATLPVTGPRGRGHRTPPPSVTGRRGTGRRG